MHDPSHKVLIGGGGGFIGGHLVGDLIRKGYKNIRCVDVKPKSEWYQVHEQAENIVADMNLRDAAFDAVKGMDVVYNLACNMGGMGFIENNKGLCMISVLINTQLLMGAKEHGAKKLVEGLTRGLLAVPIQQSLGDVGVPVSAPRRPPP